VPTQTPSPIVSPTVNPSQGLVPATLLIPSIGVSAHVEQVTVDAQHNMAAPEKPLDVGWYSPGPAPGQDGDAVIDGHLDWYGMPQAVFYNLSKLSPGSEIDVVLASGKTVKFQVTDAVTVPYTAHPAGLFATTGPPRLSLITCAGGWDQGKSMYTQRLIVDAREVTTAI
jgi:sortase (surface protein transpeptidase)